MPLKEKSITKLYWTIGEVATELGVNTSTIRYWEKEFDGLRPKRTGRGDRLYTEKEIERLRRIQHLVKEQGYTLQGARERLRDSDAPTPPPRLDSRTELRDRLLGLREALVALRDSLRSA